MTDTTLPSLAQRIRDLKSDHARVLVAIAGPPASGKSTLAETLATMIGATARVVPMDGFHLDNDALRDLGLLHRKGAPETFDAAGFVACVKSLRDQGTLTYPTFDRAADCTVPEGGAIGPDTRIVLVEGNYLLLNVAPWDQLRDVFDLTCGLHVDRDTLQRRLIDRWLDHDLSLKDATARATDNDLRNADFVANNAFAPDVILTG